MYYHASHGGLKSEKKCYLGKSLWGANATHHTKKNYCNILGFRTVSIGHSDNSHSETSFLILWPFRDILKAGYFPHWNFDDKSYFVLVFFKNEMSAKIHNSTFESKSQYRT